MEQIIFLVIVAIVGLLRLISQVAENRRNAQAEQRPDAPAPQASMLPTQRPPANSEEERIRKFMEALGVPTSTTPPPRVEPPPQPIPEAPRRKTTVHPVDPFPRPRFELPPAPTPAPVAPPPSSTPPPTVVLPAPPPLPSRPTTTFAPAKLKRSPPPAAPPELDIWDMPQGDLGELAPVRSSARTLGSNAVPSSIAARLATQQGLRDAMVLREIFGPPRSMQPLELTRVS